MLSRARLFAAVTFLAGCLAGSSALAQATNLEAGKSGHQMLDCGDLHAGIVPKGGAEGRGDDVAPVRGDLDAAQITAAENDARAGRGGIQHHVDASTGMKSDTAALNGGL